MTYFQAVVIALVQGVTELFPVSSLGHSVLVPAWLGGSWRALATQSSTADSGSSFYLASIVALHCATALALVWFFRADWARIIRGFLRSLPASVRLSLQGRRLRLSVLDKDERLAWMIIFATIPVGLTGVALEHAFRVLFAKPAAAAVLLFVNGLILLGAEALRRSAARRKQGGRPGHRGPGPGVPARRPSAAAGDARVSPRLRLPRPPSESRVPAEPRLSRARHLSGESGLLRGTRLLRRTGLHRRPGPSRRRASRCRLSSRRGRPGAACIAPRAVRGPGRR